MSSSDTLLNRLRTMEKDEMSFDEVDALQKTQSSISYNQVSFVAEFFRCRRQENHQKQTCLYLSSVSGYIRHKGEPLLF